MLPKQLQRDYPKPAGAESESLDLRVEHACLTKRVSIEKALDCVDRPPGVGSWIFDGRIRTILTKWRAETGNCKKTKLGWTLVDGKFPLMTPKKETPEIQKLFPIKRVKIASLLTDVVEFSGRPQLFETGSNHHVAIFRNISSPARKVGKVVTMLEASKRSRSGDIVLRNPNEVSSIDQKLIPEDWQFDMSLCAHDMVHMGSIENCDNSSIREKLVEQSALGLPIYRVQKFSKNLDGGILLVFRHFSVTSSADTDNRGVVRCSPHTLPTEARKVEIDPLGNWRFERRD